MGGGWSKQGSGVPLSERVRVGAAVPAAPASPASTSPATAEHPCPARHCWVSDALDGDAVRRPGLLSQWRQRDGGWEGLVIYAARLRGEEWVLVTEWVPAALLTPL